MRVWLPDRPGALGAVASRIGAVRGDVVGIDILETGGGTAVDELVVSLPAATSTDLLVAEIQEVDGVKVEDLRLIGDEVHDPRLDALETAAQLVGTDDPVALDEALCVHAARTLGSSWAVLIDADHGDLRSCTGPAPDPAWLLAFVAGSRAGAGNDPDRQVVDDVCWAPLPANELALVVGRNDGPRFRARERRQVAALARIADTRRRELVRRLSRATHPSRR